jgi:hypothetical protein
MRRTRLLGPLLFLLFALGLALALRLLWREIEWANTLGNVIVGAILALGASTYIEKQKREQLVADLSVALYHELANRVARCCFDFEEPWSGLWTTPRNRGVFEVTKFIPQPPTVFDSNADKLTLLGPQIPAAMMAFYFRLWVLGRDIEALCKTEVEPATSALGYGPVTIIASRFGATLAPGLAALQALGEKVDGFKDIDAAAWDTFDKPPNNHDEHGSLRVRLARSVAIADENFAKGK